MALPDNIRHASASSRSTGISSQSIADGASYAGSEIDNATNKDTLMSVELAWSYGTAPTADKTVELHVLYAIDGTNYEDLSVHTLRSAVSPPADTSSYRRLLLDAVPIAPFKFKLAVKNTDTGQSITATVTAYTWQQELAD